MSEFVEDTTLKILQSKLYGRGVEAVHELSNVELALVRNQLETWVVKLAQAFADRIGDLDRAQAIINDMMSRPLTVRARLAQDAAKILEAGDMPRPREFAAFILANASDQFHIEDEITRRERLQ